jgi:hypothetical protein
VQDPPRPRNYRVAIFNDGYDTMALLTNWLASHGHQALTARLQDMRGADTGAADFISRNRADVVLFDVGLPYRCNWDFGEVLQLLPGAEGVPFVFTTANKGALEKLVGTSDAFELTGTPENLDALLALVDGAFVRGRV